MSNQRAGSAQNWKCWLGHLSSGLTYLDPLHLALVKSDKDLALVSDVNIDVEKSLPHGVNLHF